MPPTAFGTIARPHTPVSQALQSVPLSDGMVKDLTAMAGDSGHPNGFLSKEETGERQKYLKQDFFYKEPCCYTQKIYFNAAKVFKSLKHKSREELENPYYRNRNNETEGNTLLMATDMEFENDSEKRLTFELAFETLKYQRVFEDLLQECSFFTCFPECQEDEALVYVVLWDYQSRKFQQRTPFQDELLDPNVQSVEDAVFEYKTKLNAALARHRIKAMAPSIEFLLPDKVRNKEEVCSKLPVYVWVNQLKTSVNTVISQFKDEHYRLVDIPDHFEGRIFYIDQHCPDLLVFPSECRDNILDHELLHNGHIVMQDKSSCIAPQSIRYLIGDDDDVIHVNAGSGVITAHISSLMNGSLGHIFAFGALGGQAVHHTAEKLGAKNIKVQTESFLDVETDDSKFKNAKVVLITADCSKSGISNPIDFVVNEGEDMKILKFLSLGETDESKLGEMIANHGKLLKHAMKLSKVQAVVYMTRSINDSENENIVNKAIEYTNMVQPRKFPWRVVPPVLPFSGSDIEKGVGISGKFVKFKPSETYSGCFVAVITREPEDIKEAHKDILDRAHAKGLFGIKKKKERKVVEAEPVGNGLVEAEGEKLLEKRIKRAPRRLRTSLSYPANFSYSKTSATSVLKASPKHKATKSTPTIQKPPMTRLHLLTPPIEKKEKPIKVAEHLKVVKHPAPFSFNVSLKKHGKHRR